jgi:K+-transporting ATPase KdpF subunit
VGLRGAVRAADGRWAMSGVETISLLVALGLFAYLTVALLKPEWFA